MPTLRLRRLSRYRWPLALSAVFALTAIAPLPPLIDVANPAAHLGAELRTPIMYELIAPVSDVLDAITFLSPAQYWSTFATCALVFVLLALRGPLSSRMCLRTGLRLLGGTIAVVGLLLVAKRE